VLGPFEVRRGETPVELGGSQPRTVLAHLAMDAGRVVSVDRLIERLWGDEPPSSALGTLQSYVSRLRRGLEPDRRPGASASVLASEAPGYALRVDRSQVDVFRFDVAANQGRELAAAGRLEEAVAHFDAALAMWRGPALGGLVGESALVPTITRLDESRRLVIEDRFEAMLGLGRHAAVVGDLQEAVGEHPLRERLWGQLALALYRSRRQADALRAITTARRTLGDELGLDLSPELRQLESQILDHHPALLAVSTPTVRILETSRPEQVGMGASPLIGRPTEWVTAMTAADRAADGAATVALVEGEAGIGKSTLLGAVADDLRRRGWTVLAAQCVEEGLAPALWPWIEVLRGVRDSTARGDDHRARANELLTLIEDDAEAVTPVEVAEAIVTALLLLATDGPLLIVMEDLHWADSATLEVLPLVVARLASAPVLVIASLRPTDIGTGAPLSTALGAIVRLPGIARIMLHGLAPDAVGELFAEVGGIEPTDEQTSRIHQRTGGNPLFVAELARLGSARLDDGEVPDAVRDVVRRRLTRLPAATLDLLISAAVLGQDIDLDVVAEVASLSTDRCLDDLDPAVVTRILVPGDAGRFRFAHALVRDAVMADLSPLRRARIHQRAADAIEHIFGASSDHLERIAAHRWEALAVDDPFKVGEALCRAAVTTTHRRSLDRAKDIIDRAFIALRRAPAGERRTSLELDALESRLSVASIEAQTGALEDVTALVDGIAERNNSEIGRILGVYMRWALHPMGWADEAAAHVERALELAESSPTPYVVMMGRYMAAVHSWLGGNTTAALTHISIALDACRSVQASGGALRLAPVDVGGVASFVFATAGEPDEAIAEARRLGAPGAWVGSRVDTNAQLLNNAFTSAVIDAIRGRPADVAKHVRQYVTPTFPLQLDPFWSAGQLLDVWARACLRGEPDDGRAIVAIGELDTGVTREMIAFYHSIYGELLLRSGDPDAALVALERSRTIALETGELWWLSEALRLLALTRQALGAPSVEVCALLEEASSLATSQGNRRLADRAAADLAAIA